MAATGIMTAITAGTQILGQVQKARQERSRHSYHESLRSYENNIRNQRENLRQVTQNQNQYDLHERKKRALNAQIARMGSAGTLSSGGSAAALLKKMNQEFDRESNTLQTRYNIARPITPPSRNLLAPRGNAGILQSLSQVTRLFG